MQFRVRLDEIVPTKLAARRLPKELTRLERGDVDQIVLTTRSSPRAVMVSVERYNKLVELETAAQATR